MPEYPYRTYVKIDLKQLEMNLQAIKKSLGSTKLMAVMKADAYGHGIRFCSRYAAYYVDWFATATLEEALAVRQENENKPILILGRLSKSEIPVAAKHRLAISVFSLEYAELVQQILSKQDLQIEAHIKIDTGMNRFGFRVRYGKEDLYKCSGLLSLDRIHFSGVYTHFAAADSDNQVDREFTALQWERFITSCKELENMGFPSLIRHCSATGAVFRYPEFKSNMIRTGMLILGQGIPSESELTTYIHPILTWFARIVDIHDIEADESVGYGREYISNHSERIAVVSCGYADGYPRALSNNTQVLVHGVRCPVRGKICMDFMMVDISSVPEAKVGETVILLGRSGDTEILAEELALKVPFNTNGGITSAIMPRVPRLYWDGVSYIAQTAPVY